MFVVASLMGDILDIAWRVVFVALLLAFAIAVAVFIFSDNMGDRDRSVISNYESRDKRWYDSTYGRRNKYLAARKREQRRAAKRRRGY